MSAASERRRWVWTTARGSLSNDGWFAYSPVGRSYTRAERQRRRWYGSRAFRVLALPRTVRAANRAYREELGR